jgi:MraZ protein
MFRGNADATVDGKGRLKIPSKFRTPLLSEFGKRVFVTSFGSPSMKVYPLSEWMKWEVILRNSGWGDDPRVERFLRHVSLYGDEQEIDGQGRILVNTRLRKHASMNGEVVVLGQPTNMLEVWNLDLLNELQDREPVTEENIRFVTRIIREARHGGEVPPPPGDDSGSSGVPMP